MGNELLVKTIRELCQKSGISISQLETDLNFGTGLVSRWTKSSPSIDRIVDIADYFNISLDEVVGYRNIIDDKFIEKLISQTVDKTIKWNKYENSNENQPKMFSNPYEFDFDNFSDQHEYMHYCETHKEISYFVKINNSYVSIYGNYEYQNIIDPSEIKLFIQPDDKGDLVEQLYDNNQLKTLWLKVLYSLGEKAPDEIKAEEFKNSFINDFNKPTPKKKTILVVTKPNGPNSPKNYRNTPRKPNDATQHQIIKPSTKPLSAEDNKNNDSTKQKGTD